MRRVRKRLTLMSYGAVGCVLCICGLCFLAGSSRAEDKTPAELLTAENIVQFSHLAELWASAGPGQILQQNDGLRTGLLSRATVRLTDLSVIRVNEVTTLRILPPAELGSMRAGFNIKSGAAYFFSREKPEDIRIETPVASGALRGTEFHVAVAQNGKTTVTIFDGEMELSNSFGRLIVSSGEQAQVEPGSAPTKTAVIEAVNIIQWCLYYPGIIDVDELKLPAFRRKALGASLAAYRLGDLLAALKEYPNHERASSDAERVYHAAVLLAVGQVDKAKAEIAHVAAASAGRRSIAELIAAVKYQSLNGSDSPGTASEWLARSYYLQSRSQLEEALTAAQRAVEISPSFGYAWTRVAELQFSFGRTRQALAALEKGVAFAPRNAQAFALRGFLYSAQNNIKRGIDSFNQAITLDGALGNAWLGRGLCFIRQGKDKEGRADIQTAAVLEPNRSVFHSYLGKAFSNAGHGTVARREFERAVQIDPNDPTPWLYSALQDKQEHRLNEAVRNLGKSIALNDNRRLYRSEFLLDQDRAVRSTNLASIYQDDGMTEFSVREATRAVEFDYADASAHRFLADSLNALRDPRRIILRFETPWSEELLLYNLLSPVGGGSLSAYVSDQEYSKLFEADRLAVASSTSYYSTGEIREVGSQYGTFGNVSYSLDTEYLYGRSLHRSNSQTTNFEFALRTKLQLAPEDSVYLQIEGLDLREGDVRQLYNQQDNHPQFHFHENQEPGIVLAGYHHEWSPGVHTLLLVGRIADWIQSTTPQIANKLAGKDDSGRIVTVGTFNLSQFYRSSFEIYTGEFNQIFQSAHNTLIFGARFQEGSFDTSVLLRDPSFSGLFFNPAAAQAFVTDFQKQSLYIYDIAQPCKGVSLTIGGGFDRMNFPQNYRDPPILNTQSNVSRFSPKAGITWSPFGNAIIRGAYTRALGGVSFDESISLEPSTVAGFNQVFRTIIPESIVGSVAAPKYDNAGLSFEDKFNTGTYIGVAGTMLKSTVRREVGDFETGVIVIPPNVIITHPFLPRSTSEALNYRESNLTATVNQLLGEEWSLGLRYTVSDASLDRLFPDVPRSVHPSPNRREQAILQQLDLFALFNHQSGFFARADAFWYDQTNSGYIGAGLPGDDFWQFNVSIGYRFRRNLGEISLGCLNIAGTNYQLNPLNLYEELPRERTLLVRVKLSF